MKILGIETSSPLFSLSINEDDQILYEIRKNRTLDKSRDAQFFVEAKRLTKYLGNEKIAAIAVSIGPGMFTSLRVGLSLAKGFALSHGIPVVAVNTLDVIGVPIVFSPYPVLTVINAYHGELYAAIYENGRRLTDYMLTTTEDIKKKIKSKISVVGSGITMLKESSGLKQDKIHFLEGDSFLPTASKVIALALPRIRNHDFDKIEELEPYYLKKTDAERNIT